MNAIRIQELTYTYPATVDPALRGISLEIPQGQFCGIVGPNGSGKSTLCYAITGFIPHFYKGKLRGDVEAGGFNVPDTPLSDLAGELGLVMQDPFNQITGARFTVREEIGFGLENLGIRNEEMEQRISQVMDLMGLEELEDRSPYSLSGGQQQRLALASVLAMQPSILVLDEPTSQLDPVGTRELFQAMKRLTEQAETTILLTEQKLEWLAHFADRVILLDSGEVYGDGSPSDVLGSRSLLEHGLAPTRFTQAALLAQNRGYIHKKNDLPVTLEAAEEFFSEN